MDKEKLTYEDYVKMDVAKEIFDICALTPEHGNAVMDIIGEEAYQRVMDLVKQRNEMIHRWIKHYNETKTEYIKKGEGDGNNNE